jgi:hypothetical protein
MNNRPDDPELPTRIPLRPTAVGRGLPVPPLIPLLAVVCLLVGLAAGYRIAPNHEASSPSPTTSEPEITVAPSDFYQVWPADGIVMTFPPTLPTEFPPATGLSMKQALGALEGLGWGLPPSTIVSARVDRFGNVGWDTSVPPDEWVWVFVVAGDNDGSIVCGPVTPEATADPSASPSAPPIQIDSSPEVFMCRATPMNATVVLDYTTGELIEAQSSPAGD